MQEESITSVPTQSELKNLENKHFWSFVQIFATAFFATPFAAFYLISMNFKLQQQANYAKYSIIAGIFINLIILPLLATLAIKFYPSIPHIIIPLILAIVVRIFAEFKQEKAIQQFKKYGLKRYSIIRWVLVTIILGIIGLIFFLISWFLIIYSGLI